jgi:uncharacterized protein (TIGR02996 family)
MTTDRDLLDAIRQAPDEDPPRLVYADWLEEHGDEAGRARAELIRTQVALANPPEDRVRRRALWEREEGLLARYEKKWLATLKACGVKEWKLDRGLVGQVRIPAYKFLDNADTLFAAEPIHQVRLTDARPVVNELAKCKALECVRSLDLRENKLVPEQVEGLLKSRYLRELTGLDLSDNSVGLAGIRAVTRSGMQLAWLRLTRCRLGKRELQALASARPLGLRRLDLAAAGIFDDATLAALLGSAALTGLRELSIPHPLWPQSAEALSYAPGLEGLQRLWITLWPLAPARTLAAGPNLRGLRYLELTNSTPCAGTWEAFVEAAAFRRLEVLRLGDLQPHLGDAGPTALAAAPWATGLRSLFIYRDSVTNAGALALARSPHLAGLHELNLEGNQIGTVGARALAEAPFAAGLRKLGLWWNPVGDEGLKALAAPARFPRLVNFSASHYTLGPAGVQALIDSGLIGQLDSLDLDAGLRGEDAWEPVRQAALAAGLRAEGGFMYRAPTRQERSRPLWESP